MLLSLDFERRLQDSGLPPLRRGAVTTLQVNVGKLCNQACHHCHVRAGPTRTERMGRAVAERVLELLAASPGIEVLDLTGGAPELNECFRDLVRGARRGQRAVIDRCNLTVLFEPGQEDLPEFLAAHQVHLIASLPCYLGENVDAQRGGGVFEKSVRALRRLNALGYGLADSPLGLDLVYNPLGPVLPPPQAALEAAYKSELGRRHGLQFHRLLALTNMPIERFADDLRKRGQQQAYQDLLVSHFQPATVEGLMCRSLVSVGWDGRLYDCDFNQMLALPLGGEARTVFDLDSFETLGGQRIASERHCFGCTAGAGSGCGGALT